MNELMYMQDMTDNQKMLFQSQYNSQKKDTAIAVILAIFLGGLGAHCFYLGKVGLGIIYLLFCWTFIPAIIALIEALMMSGTVRRMNQKTAQQIAMQIKAMG